MKQWLVLLVATAFAMSLIGCGGDGPRVAQPPPVVAEMVVTAGVTTAEMTTRDLLAFYTGNLGESPVELTVSGAAPLQAAAQAAPAAPAYFSREGEHGSALWTNAVRLKQIFGATRPLTSRMTRADITVGETFSIALEGADDGYIDVTVQAIGEHCYVLVDQHSSIDAAIAQQIAQVWDATVYPTVTGRFGPATDIDGWPRVFLLFTPFFNNGSDDYPPTGFYGMFDPGDQYPYDENENPYSNEADILYFNSAYAKLGYGSTPDLAERKELIATMAHEFQHMTYFNARESMQLDTDTALLELFINEGLSMLAETFVGGGLTHGSEFAYDAVLAFQRNGGRCYLDVFNNDYGAAYLLLQYLYDRFGSDVIGKIYASQLIGIENAADAVDLTVDELMHDWALANVLDKLSKDPRYNYPSLDMKGNFTGRYYGDLPGIIPQPFEPTEEIYSYMLTYYYAQEPGNYTLTLGAGDTPFGCTRMTIPLPHGSSWTDTVVVK